MNKKFLMKISQHLVYIYDLYHDKKYKNTEIEDNTDYDKCFEFGRIIFIVNFKCKEFMLEPSESNELYYELIEGTREDYVDTVNYYFNQIDGIVVKRYFKYNRNKKLIKWSEVEKNILLQIVSVTK